MSKWIYLSYPLSSDTPAYGGDDSLKISHGKSMARGDSCNTSYWSLSNHLGTHIDCPRHFIDNGETVDNYSPGFWVFCCQQVLDISPIKPGSLIGPHNIRLDRVSRASDLLFIKTGFCGLRDREIYWRENPGIEPDTAFFLRENLPNLRVLGFDFISLSSFVHKEIGRDAHKAFLDLPSPILPLEDVNLSQVDAETRLKTVIISPLVIQKADAAPCTVFAQILED